MSSDNYQHTRVPFLDDKTRCKRKDEETYSRFSESRIFYADEFRDKETWEELDIQKKYNLFEVRNKSILCMEINDALTRKSFRGLSMTLH